MGAENDEEVNIRSQCLLQDIVVAIQCLKDLTHNMLGIEKGVPVENLRESNIVNINREKFAVLNPSGFHI